MLVLAGGAGVDGPARRKSDPLTPDTALETAAIPVLCSTSDRPAELIRDNEPFVIEQHFDAGSIDWSAPFWREHRVEVTVVDSSKPVVTRRAGVAGEHEIVEMNLRDALDRVIGEPRPEAADPIDTSAERQIYVTTKGLLTKAHYDEESAFLTQMAGEKHVMMFSPADYDNLYPVHEGDVSGHDRRCLADLRSPDFQRFPRLRRARAHEVVLRAGDTLFLPANWWHEMTALRASVTYRAGVRDPVSLLVRALIDQCRSARAIIEALPQHQRVLVLGRLRDEIASLADRSSTSPPEPRE
jgi:hypothetical protein